MKHIIMEHLNKTTTDGTQFNLDELYKILPACFTEIKSEDGLLKRVVDWTKLRSFLGDNIEENAPEIYDFSWVGKREAQREAASPISKTLRPIPEKSVNWDSTQNIYIEGDNLEVLKILQNSYMGKVKMIFIDPPYNTGSDFIYHDNFTKSFEEYDEHNINEDGERFRKNTDSNGRFHSDWCSMMYSRLLVARSLLREDGAIFISIDYNESHNLRKILDEVFGVDNFQREIIWRMGWLSGYKTTAPNFIRNHDTIFFYTKNSSKFTFNKKYIDNEDFKPLFRDTKAYRDFCSSLVIDSKKSKSLYDFINYSNRPERYPIEDTWNCNEYDDLNSIQIVSFSGEKVSKYLNVSEDFKGQKSIKMLSRLFDCCIEKDDIVLDFFSGTASTAHAAIEYSLHTPVRFIMVQIEEPTNPEGDYYNSGYRTLCDIGEERIRKAGEKIKEENSLMAQNLDIGFRVFRCDTSNFKNVKISPNEYSQEGLDTYLNNIKEDRSDLDLLFDCMLRWGVELSLPISSKKVGDCTIHNVNDGDLVACFDGAITEDIISAIAEMNPLRVVFRDNSFEEASQKMNLFELFKQKCDWTDQEVINNVKVI